MVRLWQGGACASVLVMDELNFTNKREFEAWLKGKPREWAQVLALRSALRVAPFAWIKRSEIDRALHLRLADHLRRSLMISWGAAFSPSGGIIWAFPAAHHVDVDADADAAYAAAYAAHAAAYAGNTYAEFAAAAATTAAHAAANNARAYAYATAEFASSAAADDSASAAVYAVWGALSSDASRLANGAVPKKLLAASLWSDVPGWAQTVFDESQQELRELGQRFDLWATWFDRRWRGEDLGFNLRNGEAEIEFNRRLFEKDDVWWKRDSALVNAEIAEWVEELGPVVSGLSADPQAESAPYFGWSSGSRIGVEAAHGNDQLRKDESARKLHEKARDRAGKLGSLLRGNNNAAEFSPICDDILGALGETLDELEPGILILEAQSLRDQFEIQQSYQKGKSDFDPLEGSQLKAAKDSISALNLLIGSDPYLEEIEKKRLGPDHEGTLATPDEIIEFADALVEDELTEEQADHVLRQASKFAPQVPDPLSRKTSIAAQVGLNIVRFSVSFIVNNEKNLANYVGGGTAAGVLVAPVTTGALLVAGWKLAQNIKNNEAKWRKIANSAEVTSQNFDELMRIINKLPLK